MKVNCPNCGAPIVTTASRCPYCDTPYTLKLLEAFVRSEKNIENVSVLYADDKPIEYARYVECGVMTPNEAREALGLKRLPEVFSTYGITCSKAEKAFSDFSKALKEI